MAPRLLSIPVLLYTLAAPAICAEATTLLPFAKGTAYDMVSGNLLYTETHHCQADRQYCKVYYQDSEGQTFLEKSLDYQAGLSAPALAVTDFRNGTTRRFNPETQQNLVVDAGFDNFVRYRWQELEAGAVIAFPFQGMGSEDPFDMRIARSTETGCSTDNLCLKINVDSWLLRPFVSPITLVYSRTSRSLLHYSGVSNIRDEQGVSLEVDIYYTYENIDDMTPATSELAISYRDASLD